MVNHSSILAWRIPWMEKPGRLQSTGSQRVGHNWATSHSFIQVCNLGFLLIGNIYFVESIIFYLLVVSKYKYLGQS